MKLIAISNQKGGVGKTTTTLNLASALALAGKRTLILDLDPQANCTSGLSIDAPAGSSIYPVLLNHEPLQNKVLPTGRENLFIIPSEMDLAGVEIELARNDNHLLILRGVLQDFKKTGNYDYCLIDTPPSLGILMTSALAAADEALIPLQCEWFGLEGLAKIVHVIDQIRLAGVNPALRIEGVVMTMYDGRTLLSRQVVEEVSKYFPKQLYKTLIPRSIRIGESPSYGKNIFEHDPTGPGAQTYAALADEFLARRGDSK